MSSDSQRAFIGTLGLVFLLGFSQAVAGGCLYSYFGSKVMESWAIQVISFTFITSLNFNEFSFNFLS